MDIVLATASLVLVGFILVECFEVIMLPRRITRPYRFTRLFYVETWSVWRVVARRLPRGKRRNTFLSVFGPLSLMGLLLTWVVALIIGFGLLHWTLGTPLQDPQKSSDFLTYCYLSGVTFFTLGYGDVVTLDTLGRFLSVVEAGMGFIFLACVIGYLPVLYQAFSRREVTISLMDARAGSPPSAGQLLLRLARARNLQAINPFLVEWERWSAEVLESHISYPLMAFYRSQHDNQSWLASLTVILDTCAVLMVCVKDFDSYQAQLTFAMARHAVVDLAMVLQVRPRATVEDRLPSGRWQALHRDLHEAGIDLRTGPAVAAKLAELRSLYETFVNALGNHLLLDLPPVVSDKLTVDNWQTSAWMGRTPGIGHLPVSDDDDHKEG